MDAESYSLSERISGWPSSNELDCGLFQGQRKNRCESMKQSRVIRCIYVKSPQRRSHLPKMMIEGELGFPYDASTFPKAQITTVGKVEGVT
jgi:hypothetical protein